ncbi:hypothetical protein GCM10017608_35210 [Agromyces luteolus]|nr:hypothetical protein GCM10017608_35210 [Agromyces luteolus]
MHQRASGAFIAPQFQQLRSAIRPPAHGIATPHRRRCRDTDVREPGKGTASPMPQQAGIDAPRARLGRACPTAGTHKPGAGSTDLVRR